MANDAEDVRRLARERTVNAERATGQRDRSKEIQRAALEEMCGRLTAITREIPEIRGYLNDPSLNETDGSICFSDGTRSAFEITCWTFSCYYDPTEELFIVGATEYNSGKRLNRNQVVEAFKQYLGEWIYVSLPAAKKDRERFQDKKRAEAAHERNETAKSLLWLVLVLGGLGFVLMKCLHRV